MSGVACNHLIELYFIILLLSQATYGGKHPDFASLLNNLGLLLKAKGEFAEAKDVYERAIAIQKSAFGKFHPDIGMIHHILLMSRM